MSREYPSTYRCDVEVLNLNPVLLNEENNYDLLFFQIFRTCKEIDVYISFDAASANVMVLWSRVGVEFKLYC